MSFNLIAAIDIKNGECVRLRQGEAEQVTVYSDNVLQTAQKWIDNGTDRLHLVDLDGAFQGAQKNSKNIKNVLEHYGKKVPIQVGGGVRSMKTVDELVSQGASFVVIGTAAIENPEFVKEACRSFEGRIIVSMDARNGKVATRGWKNNSNQTMTEAVKRIEDYGVSSILYTDISRDGMQVGINLESTLALASITKIPVIASGGLSSESEIFELSENFSKGIQGVILGKALYEGKIRLSNVSKKLQRLRGPNVN